MMPASFFGSSRKSGKGGFDFEEEVFVIAEPIGHAFDDLDSVVHAFKDDGVEMVSSACDDAVDVWS